MMEDTKNSAAPFDKDDYNYVVQNARLIDVALTASDFKLSPEFFSDDNQKKLSTKYDVLNCELKNQILIALIRFSVLAKKGNKKLLKCDADYNVVFLIDGESINDEAAKAFGSHMAQFTAYPYFRQHVAHRAWESGAELPILPIIKQMPTKRLKKPQPGKPA